MHPMFGEIMNLTDIRRAFVTGGAGFIGSHIVDRLAQTAANVTIYDNFSTGQEQFISHHAENPKVRVVRADVLDSERLKKKWQAATLCSTCRRMPTCAAASANTNRP